MKEYDILIIGGGPAGLSAARMSAGLNQETVLLEKLSKPGELGHPCSGAIGPLPDFVSGQRRMEGLYYPEIDLFTVFNDQFFSLLHIIAVQSNINTDSL